MMERIESLARENEALRAEVERLRAGADRLLWNLAKCSTIACSKTPTEFNREWAKPALHEVNELAKEYQDLKAEVERLRRALESDVHAAVVDDACMSFRHDFGLLSHDDQQILRRAALVWLEVWGKAILEPSAATRAAIGEAGI